jgi:hypothetical protein
MRPDLKTIVDMEFGIVMDRLRKEKDTRLTTALAGLQRGGPHTTVRQQIELEFAEKSCTALAEIWVRVLEEANNGILTRKDIDLIKGQVQGVARARRAALSQQPPMAPNQSAIAAHVAREMETVISNGGRYLELRFQRQEAGLGKGEPMKDGINLTVHNAANINFGSQVGTINAAVGVISQQGQGEVATAIRELSEAIQRSSAIKDHQKQEALQAIAEIAKQAETKPEARSTGTLRALMVGFPSLIAFAADVTTLWDKFGPLIRSYFGI